MRNDPNEKQMNRKRLTDLKNGCQGKGIVGDFGKVMYIQLYLKWITDKDIVKHMELCSVLYASLDERGSQGRMGMYS